MNNSIIDIKDPQAIQEAINELKASHKVLSEIFKTEKINAEKVNETDTWSGDAAKAFYSKYKMLNNNYNEIEYSFDLYIRYLEKIMEDYRLNELATSQNIDAMAEELDVNS